MFKDVLKGICEINSSCPLPWKNHVLLTKGDFVMVLGATEYICFGINFELVNMPHGLDANFTRGV